MRQYKFHIKKLMFVTSLKFNFFPIIFLFVSFSLIANVKSDLDYYPLNDGDYKEYVETTITDTISYSSTGPELLGTDTIIDYYSLTILGDTLMNNGETYKKIVKCDLQYQNVENTFIYERVEEEFFNVFLYDNLNNIEVKIDSLSSQVGDLHFSHRFDYTKTSTEEISTQTVLGFETQVKKNRRYPQYNNGSVSIYKLASEIGYIYHFWCDPMPPMNNKYTSIEKTKENRRLLYSHYFEYLTYAIINDIEYGEQYVGIEDDNKKLVLTTFQLAQNYPNPFNPVTTIQYSLPVNQHVNIKVFNIQGKEVAELVNDNISAGIHKVNFDGSSLASGQYFYKIETEGFTQTNRMLLIK